MKLTSVLLTTVSLCVSWFAAGAHLQRRVQVYRSPQIWALPTCGYASVENVFAHFKLPVNRDALEPLLATEENNGVEFEHCLRVLVEGGIICKSVNLEDKLVEPDSVFLVAVRTPSYAVQHVVVVKTNNGNLIVQDAAARFEVPKSFLLNVSLVAYELSVNSEE